MKNSHITWLVTLAALLFVACAKDDTMMDDPPVTNTGPEQYGTPFDGVPATADIQMYEVNPKVFSGTRDLDGITARLDSIHDLGINVVWLMPIYPTGTVNSVGSPYAIRDYEAINPEYGNLEDLRELTDKAHGLGMAVILDWVANHTAWDHPWINNHPDWYSQDANGDIIHPPGTNWQDVADLNFDNNDIREEMIAAMKYWVLEANVDGYRCDYADGVPLDFWEAAIDTLQAIPDRELVLFAEGSDKGLLLESGFGMIFGWPFYGELLDVFGGGSATNIRGIHLSEYHFLEEGHHIVRWITNHDQHAWDETPEDAFGGEDAALAAFVLASHYGGVPLVYNGQEVAVPYQLGFFEGTTATIPWGANADVTAEYRQLLQFRRDSDALRRGAVEDYSTDDVAIFKRILGTEEVLVLVNVRGTGFDNVTLPTEIANTVWVDAHTGDAVSLGSSVGLSPYAYLVLVKE